MMLKIRDVYKSQSPLNYYLLYLLASAGLASTVSILLVLLSKAKYIPPAVSLLLVFSLVYVKHAQKGHVATKMGRKIVAYSMINLLIFAVLILLFG